MFEWLVCYIDVRGKRRLGFHPTQAAADAWVARVAADFGWLTVVRTIRVRPARAAV
jgi:hypothetical protein